MGSAQILLQLAWRLRDPSPFRNGVVEDMPYGRSGRGIALFSGEDVEAIKLGFWWQGCAEDATDESELNLKLAGNASEG